jgi:squalene-associated FAD-dependent desaturase
MGGWTIAHRQDAVTSSRRPHVVVVGGGLAGLAAGLACADRGVAVTVIESRPRLGGATWSFERNGRWFDNGQHVFLRCCSAYRELLERLGTTAGTRLQPRLAIPVLSPGRPVAWIRRAGLPVPLHLAPSLARYRHLGAWDRLRLGPATLALSRLDLADSSLDQETFGAWLARHGQSEEAVAGLWDLITRPTVNLPASRASLAMAAKVFQTGLLSDPCAADIGWARLPLSHLHGEAARTALARAGAAVRLRAKVTAVEDQGGEQVAVVAGGERLPADSVVVAVPHDAARQLLPAAALPGLDRLGALGTSPIVDVHLVFDRRVTELELAAGLGTPVQWLFDRTASAHGGQAGGWRGEQVIAVSLSAADQWLGRRPEELIELFRSEVARLLPRARSARLLDAVVSRERAATFAAAPGTAGLRPGPRTALPQVALAGAWTATGWPATMEGAVRSGLAAARQVLAGLELTRSLPVIPEDRPAWSPGAHRPPCSGDRRTPSPRERRSPLAEAAA